MLVVTAGTREFAPMIKAQFNKCHEFGYKHIAYDIGDLGFGPKYEVDPADLKGLIGDNMPPTTFKIELLSRSFKEDETLCWLDGDCIPLKPFEPDGEWDAAVTLRPLNEIGRSGISATDYLNAGVIWFRNRDFIESWEIETVLSKTDQEGLNEAVGLGHDTQKWKDSMNTTIMTEDGLRVKILDASEWNCWNFPPNPKARILHFKRGLRNEARKYCQ